MGKALFLETILRRAHSCRARNRKVEESNSFLHGRSPGKNTISFFMVLLDLERYCGVTFKAIEQVNILLALDIKLLFAEVNKLFMFAPFHRAGLLS